MNDIQTLDTTPGMATDAASLEESTRRQAEQIRQLEAHLAAFERQQQGNRLNPWVIFVPVLGLVLAASLYMKTLSERQQELSTDLSVLIDQSSRLSEALQHNDGKPVETTSGTVPVAATPAIPDEELRRMTQLNAELRAALAEAATKLKVSADQVAQLTAEKGQLEVSLLEARGAMMGGAVVDPAMAKAAEETVRLKETLSVRDARVAELEAGLATAMGEVSRLRESAVDGAETEALRQERDRLLATLAEKEKSLQAMKDALTSLESKVLTLLGAAQTAPASAQPDVAP